MPPKVNPTYTKIDARNFYLSTTSSEQINVDAIYKKIDGFLKEIQDLDDQTLIALRKKDCQIEIDHLQTMLSDAASAGIDTTRI